MSKIFWKDGFQGKATGGYYFRAFDLVKFFKRLNDNDNSKRIIFGTLKPECDNSLK